MGSESHSSGGRGSATLRELSSTWVLKPVCSQKSSERLRMGSLATPAGLSEGVVRANASNNFIASLPSLLPLESPSLLGALALHPAGPVLPGPVSLPIPSQDNTCSSRLAAVTCW